MTAFFRWLTLCNYFALMVSLICWIILDEHGPYYPAAAWLIIALVPLLFPLRGLLHGQPYTYAWSSFLMLFYFTHGIGELYSAQQLDLYAALEVTFSVVTFMAALVFIRLNARHQP